jgi:hypothetical protein
LGRATYDGGGARKKDVLYGERGARNLATEGNKDAKIRRLTEYVGVVIEDRYGRRWIKTGKICVLLAPATSVGVPNVDDVGILSVGEKNLMAGLVYATSTCCLRELT